jgi:hypothetical protein
MRARRFIQYGVLGGLVLAGLACAGNSARTEDTAVAKDTTAAQDTSAYRAMSRDTTIRDTSVTAVSDSAKWSQTKSGATEIKAGESTVRADSTVGIDSTKMTPDQSQPVPAKVDTLRTTTDTTK